MRRSKGVNQMSMLPKYAIHQIASDFLGVAPAPATTDVSTPDYARAFDAWQSVLGTDYVLCDEPTSTEYAKTTLPGGTRPAGILRPSTTEEICRIVEIASRYAVPLHAISRGKNWGYGDACAPTHGQVIVELTRMNRIREVNVELGYVVIEPGVSQGLVRTHIYSLSKPISKAI